MEQNIVRPPHRPWSHFPPKYAPNPIPDAVSGNKASTSLALTKWWLRNVDTPLKWVKLFLFKICYKPLVSPMSRRKKTRGQEQLPYSNR